MEKLYVIIDKTKNNNFSDILAYSEVNKLNDGSAGDGCFWTSMRYFIKCYLVAPAGKQMVFRSRKEAKRFAKRAELQCSYRIAKIQFTLV